MRRRSNPWPAFVDLFAALLVATFGGLVLLSGQFRNSGNFQRSDVSFPDSFFKKKPVDEPADDKMMDEGIRKIAEKYRHYRNDFEYIFIVGHSSSEDAEGGYDRCVYTGKDQDDQYGRFQRNWWYAGRRAAFIASRLAENKEIDKRKIVVVSMGEFHNLRPGEPRSQENARVEVFF